MKPRPLPKIKLRPQKQAADYGNTPVLRESHGSSDPKPMGLLDRIKTAPTLETLKSLADEGDKYLHASDKTRRRWERALQARFAFLNSKKLKVAA